MSDDSFSLPPPEPPQLDGRGARAVQIGAIALLAVSAAGLFTGIENERARPARPASSARSNEAPAPAYLDLREQRRGPNAHLYDHAFADLEGTLPAPTASVPPQSSAERAAVLADRSTRRAYDGAPPVVPHAVRSSGAFECLACHARGAVIAGRVAPRMSHERHDNCTQCHAPPSAVPGSPPPPLAESEFVGLPPAASGTRAWDGAPPTIPHTAQMRAVCTSCHGVAGSLGMRSTHPWRQSCTQCHAPMSALPVPSTSAP